jgi:hypothetical protein
VSILQAGAFSILNTTFLGLFVKLLAKKDVETKKMVFYYLGNSA